MSKRKRQGQRYRLPCSTCDAKLDVNPLAGRLVGLQVRGKIVTLVCDERCEQQWYNNTRFLNWILSNDAVAEHSDVIIRHDLASEHGSVSLRDGKIVYLHAPDRVTVPE